MQAINKVFKYKDYLCYIHRYYHIILLYKPSIKDDAEIKKALELFNDYIGNNNVNFHYVNKHLSIVENAYNTIRYIVISDF